MALPPRVPAAASESEAKLWSSVAARDVMVSVAYACSTASGSTTGTFSSTAYTSSRGTVLSSRFQFTDDEEEKAKRRERTMHLVKEFCHRNGGIAALKRWLSEMGVGWVLNLDGDRSAGISLLRAQPERDNLTQRWIRALTEIMESAHLEYSQCLTEEGFRDRLLRIVFATVVKMLPFVDVLLAAAYPDSSNGTQASLEKLQTLLDVRDALSSASEDIQQLCFDWDSSVEMDALLSLLSAKDHRFDEAMWNTIEEIRTSILSDGDDKNEWGVQTPQGSSSICKVTRSLMTCIKYLWNNYSRVNRIARAGELGSGSYVPNRDILRRFLLSAVEVQANPLTMLTFEMISSLEVKLTKRSESFPDHSLGLLFLINNTHFILQQLHALSHSKRKLPPVLLCHKRHHVEELAPKIDDYIQKYLQVSWVPVMSCSYNHTTRWFRKNSAPRKFDSEFQKTYTAQKFWKVADPELRTRLRKAIVDQVIPSLTKYLEDNNVTRPRVTPQKREEMLLELFEG
jgi:hypothetical protein